MYCIVIYVTAHVYTRPCRGQHLVLGLMNQGHMIARDGKIYAFLLARLEYSRKGRLRMLWEY